MQVHFTPGDAWNPEGVTVAERLFSRNCLCIAGPDVLAVFSNAYRGRAIVSPRAVYDNDLTCSCFSLHDNRDDAPGSLDNVRHLAVHPDSSPVHSAWQEEVGSILISARLTHRSS